MVQNNNDVIPIEAKAGINLKAKSLTFYAKKYNPKIVIRTSLADYKQTDFLYDVPLYTIENFLRKIFQTL